MCQYYNKSLDINLQLLQLMLTEQQLFLKLQVNVHFNK